MTPQRVLVVSIDGVAPRYITPTTMPHLCELARQGGSCFQATTVVPSITLPAHTSLLRGIDPSVHEIVDNTPLPLSDEWPSFLRTARKAGRSTAALLNWAQVNGIVEPDALDVRYFLDGGYGLDDDRRLAAAAAPILANKPDVAFAYLVSPDLAGHDHGWGSEEYCEALAESDRALGTLLRAIADDCAVIVTTDHGGHDHDHQQSEPLDMRTFVVVRSHQVAAGSTWQQASILDIAPTVAEIAGFEPPAAWSGSSLIGNEQPTVDYLLGLLDSMREHNYGEAVTMLEHSLQTAAVARAAGATNDLVAAGLLHDIGHVLGEAGRWGFADHASVAADCLQQLLPASVVEPIRHHVAAKRYLVATDHSYFDTLSTASQHSLEEQGGAFNPVEARDFAALRWADDAQLLRRFDDHGKQLDEVVPELGSYRPLLEQMLQRASFTDRWSRDSCGCPQCRDRGSGQHLIDVSDLATTADHQLVVASETVEAIDGQQQLLWRGDHRVAAHDGPTAFVSDLSRYGIALMSDVGVQPAAVLDFAHKIGFVRETNYGRLFEVKAVADPNNLAYTPLELPLHTDNPYRDPVPTVQLLHCLQPASEGGSSLFADGFAAAEQLRATAPTYFETLTRTPVDFRFCDDTVDLRARHAMIDLAVDGAVRAIHINHRSMVTPPPSAATEQFYEAYEYFAALLRSPAHMIRLDLAAGALVGFDNRRVLHARTSFPATNERHLQGCYIDIDAVHSVARMTSRSIR